MMYNACLLCFVGIPCLLDLGSNPEMWFRGCVTLRKLLDLSGAWWFPICGEGHDVGGHVPGADICFPAL